MASTTDAGGRMAAGRKEEHPMVNAGRPESDPAPA
jgi:hypothetical protein